MYDKKYFYLKRFFSLTVSLIIIFSVLYYFSPTVGGLEDPHYFYGYVYFENKTDVPAGTTVTLTDLNNSNFMTVETREVGLDITNYYQADLSRIEGSADGDTVRVNCTLNGESGSNSIAIDVSGGSQQVDVNMAAPADLSISVSPSSWNQGSLWCGISNETTGYFFNLSNDGNADIDVFIKASNATNATTGLIWTLEGSPGHDAFSLQFSKNGGSSWTNINDTYDYNNPLVREFSSSSYQTFDLKIYTATSTTDSDPLDFDITFKSVASGS